MSASNPGDLQFKYLQVGDLRRLEQMLFAPRRTVEGRFSGHYATRQRGQSVEFRDYRPYFPGDEVGAIDWRVYGRTDRLVIKLFEQQSELTVHLLIDASGSMDFRGASPGSKADSKFDYACRLAAAIGFLISKQHDRFSFSMCQRRVGSDVSPLRYFFPPDRSVRHLMGVLEGMETARPRGESALSDALHELARRGKRRELVILFSDLLGDPDEVAAALSSRVQFGGEAVVMHILHPDEIELPDVDRGIFIDSETGSKVRVDVPEIRDAYHAKMREFLEGWEARCTAMGIDYCRMETSEPYWQALERYLVGRAAVGR
ncbi:hypothetical protein Pan44_52930 [Caulifigura coniformis]|uniref:DUF58 domain-containing protein n=1 Tax=Caulifigura coniformis TaxID=2527983 RepID=A0A517SM70_9PLAN|nr:DUF58 domain-containing protein [Caulifigura coniformis]QDT57225.1 hypothetical protein Pan44_52930 [Caulifigura coniformis]